MDQDLINKVARIICEKDDIQCQCVCAPETRGNVKTCEGPFTDAKEILETIYNHNQIAQEKLKHIAEIYNSEYINEEGLHLFTDLGYSVTAALMHIKRGESDDLVVNTLEEVEKRLIEIAKILGKDLLWRGEVKDEPK